jgi:cytochrome c553
MIVRVTWKRALAAAGAAAALGLAVAWSGIVNIGASTGHAAITDWFLHWAMRNTVRTYAALTVEEFQLEPEHVVSAAGHYAATCAACHGAPGERPLPVMRASTPPAPDLAETVPTWTDRQLFWIIKHGVKFTAMPAWAGANRDDEIRRMTAFVRRLPDMSPAEYRALAYGDGAVIAGKAVDLDVALEECERCHADNGRGQPDIPALGGQKPGYLTRALAAYASGERQSGVMATAAAKIDPGLRGALAEHYASFGGGVTSADPTRLPTVTASAERAAQVVASGIPEIDLPACSECHTPDTHARNPLLAGQKAAYLASRLRNWRGDPNVVDARKPNATMPSIARRIPEDLIEPLAEYLAGPP